MNTAAVPPQASIRINPFHQLALFHHFLALSFTTTSLLMGVLISEESIIYGLLGLLYVGITQMLGAFVGALQYGRLWQAVHLMAAACFLGVQIAAISLLDGLNFGNLPESIFWFWGVGNVVISLAAGWSYWFNLRSSYAREAARATQRRENTMV